MTVVREAPVFERFNSETALPYELRWEDFAVAMQDAYDFF